MKRRTMFGLMAAGALGLVAAGGAAAYGAHVTDWRAWSALRRP